MSGTAPFPLECCRPQIAEIAASVYDTMLGTPVLTVGGTAPGWRAGLIASVFYAGNWTGAVLLECSVEQAMNWTARLLSLDPPVALDDARDGLGELTNMLAGNLKPMFPPGTSLSIPSVVLGGEPNLRLVGKSIRERICFEDESGPFAITLVQVLE